MPRNAAERTRLRNPAALRPRRCGSLFKQDLLDAEGQPIVRRTWMYYHEETLELNLVRTFVEFVKALDLKEGL